MTSALLVRRLTPADLAIWKDIRGASLQGAPHSFGQTYQGFLKQSDDQHRDRLDSSMVLASFAGNRVSGCASWAAHLGQTDSHRGAVYSFYVKPECRGQGHGDGLIAGLISDATGKVLQLELDVVSDNIPAIRLYERHGFETIGKTPRALCHDGRYFDELHMLRRLDA